MTRRQFVPVNPLWWSSISSWSTRNYSTAIGRSVASVVATIGHRACPTNSLINARRIGVTTTGQVKPLWRWRRLFPALKNCPQIFHPAPIRGLCIATASRNSRVRRGTVCGSHSMHALKDWFSGCRLQFVHIRLICGWSPSSSSSLSSRPVQ